MYLCSSQSPDFSSLQLPLFPFLFVLLDLVSEFPQPAQRLRLPHDAGSGGVQVVRVWAPGGRSGPGWTG